MTNSSDVDEILQLETYFSFRASILAKLLERRLARLVGDRFGLAVAEYRVLAQILMRPRSTVRAIAARTFVDKAQVSRAVAVLEEQALVVRTTPDEDRRSPVFTATRSGKALMKRIIPLRRAQERELVEHLGEAEMAELADRLQIIIDRLADPSAELAPSATERRQAIRQNRVERARSRG